MSDIVKRLRGDLMTPYQATQLMNEAADRIEQLEADQRDTTEEFGKLSHDLGKALLKIERLRAALDEQVQWVKDLADSLMEAEGKIGVKNARIEQLEEANELMLTDIRRTDVDMMAFKTEIEHYRKTLRDIVRQCNKTHEAGC